MSELEALITTAARYRVTRSLRISLSNFTSYRTAGWVRLLYHSVTVCIAEVTVDVHGDGTPKITERGCDIRS